MPPLHETDTWTYCYSGVHLLIAVAFGAVLGMVGLAWRFNREATNWGFVGAAAGALLLSTSYLALEQVRLTPDGFQVRSWWGLDRLALRYDELASLTEEHHYRAAGRRPHWKSLSYQTTDGRKGTISRDIGRSRLMQTAHFHLLLVAGRKGIPVQRVTD
jgi:hypothetical protein